MAAIEEKILSDGRYRLLRVIGKGGMSTVYLASDNHTGKLWAVKEMTRDAEILKKEADYLKRLDYPALPRIVDLVTEEGKLYLIMDYLPGKSVGELLREGRHFSDAEIMAVGRCICEVLCYLHGQNPPIFYLDLKPDHILITPEGRVKLIDFGIARTCYDMQEAGYGTPGFAAPEQYQGKYDQRTDLYGLGSVLLAMYGREKRKNRILRRIIKRCTSPDPKKRYRSAEELIGKIKKAQRKGRYKAAKVCLAAAVFLLCAVIGIGKGARFDQTAYQCTVDEIEKALQENEEFSVLCTLCDEAICLEPACETGYLALLEAGVNKGHTKEAIFLVRSYRNMYPAETENHYQTLERIAQLYFCGNVLDEDFAADYEKVREIYRELGGEAAEDLKQKMNFIDAVYGGKNQDWRAAADALEQMIIQVKKTASEAEQYESLIALAELIFCYEEELNPYFDDEPSEVGIELLKQAAKFEWKEPESDAKRRRTAQAAIRLGDSYYRLGMQKEVSREKLEAALDCYGSLESAVLTEEEKRHAGLHQASIALSLGDPDLAQEYLLQVGSLPGAEYDMNYQRLKKRLERIN